MNCNIQGGHIHLYINDKEFKAYKEGEFRENNNMFWTSEAIKLTDEVITISDFNLLRIDDNLKALEMVTKTIYLILNTR